MSDVVIIDENIRMKKETLYVDVKLTEEEIRQYSKELADAVEKKSRCENELQSFSKQQKAQIATHDANIAAKSHLVSTEKEFRNVKCDVILDFKKKTKTYKNDAGEVVKETYISPQEFQEEFELREEKAKTEANEKEEDSETV